MTVKLVPIPDDLKWKFVVYPDTPRYWVKLSCEVCLAQNYGVLVTTLNYRVVRILERKPGEFGAMYMYIIDHDNFGRKHESKNVCELRKTLEPILRDKLKKEPKINYWCEARLGRLVWRAGEGELHKKLDLSDVCSTKESDKEFYTRCMIVLYIKVFDLK